MKTIGTVGGKIMKVYCIDLGPRRNRRTRGAK